MPTKDEYLKIVRALEEPLDDEGVAVMLMSAEARGRRDERERCARICETGFPLCKPDGPYRTAGKVCAAKIRGDET